MYLLKKSLIIATFFLVTLAINSCGIYKKTDAPVNVDDRIQKNIEEGRGIKFGDKRNKKGVGVASFAAANPMWQATLDTLDFMVLSSADYGGGIVITDWYSSSENNNEFIKITVRFLSDEIRADGLNIIIHEKKCDELKNCKVKKVKSNLVTEIKLKILKRAVLIDKKLTKKKVKEFRKQFPKREAPKE